jgi:ribosome biogenesis GTPase
MIGKIIKSQKDLYHVETKEKTYLCKARGVFRKKGIKPLVGDNVEVDPQEENEGYIVKIYERKNEIKRPNIANIDQMLCFVTIKNPSLNLYNLDKYLAMCEYINVEVLIILSKIDIVDDTEIEKFKKIYEDLGYKVISLDNYNNFPKDIILEELKNKTSAVSGSSGVGKSTFLSNLVDDEIEIGSISEKLKRGKNTTRHIEIFTLDKDTHIFDTPGFDSFDFDFLDDENELKYYFREMDSKSCKFNNCNHINEPGCRVKKELEEGKIARSRYDNYLMLFEELKERRENKW